MNTVTIIGRRDQSVGDGDPPTPATSDPDARARAERAAAQERQDQLAAGAEDRTIDCSHRANEDLCGSETVESPQLHVRQAGDAHPIESADVKQGALNDCFLMAALAALARTPQGRALLEKVAVENRHGEGEPASYTVTLYRPEKGYFGTHTFQPVKFTVDACFGKGHAIARSDGPGTPHEIWSPVIEKAYEQLVGGYSTLNGGGSPARALEALTGRPAVDIRFGTGVRYTEADLVRDIDAGHPAVLLTPEQMRRDNPYGLVPNHGYQVVGYESSAGRLWVQLHNPTGRSEPRMVPFDELSRWFTAIDVGSVPR